MEKDCKGITEDKKGKITMRKTTVQKKEDKKKFLIKL